jgi:hypothetical protein
MTLSGQQRKKLIDALIDAFPTKSSLEQMLSLGLDKNLDVVAEGGNLKVVVFNLVKVAESQGWIDQLIDAACKENPGNQLLRTIATELRANNLTQTPYNSIKENAIAKYRNKFEEFLADDGEISRVGWEILNDLQKNLGLTKGETRAVKDEVSKNFKIYKKNLDKYRQIFTKFVAEQGCLLDTKAKADLKKQQEYYQLKDKDIALLEEEEKAKYQTKLQRHEQRLFMVDDFLQHVLKHSPLVLLLAVFGGILLYGFIVGESWWKISLGLVLYIIIWIGLTAVSGR